VEKFLPAHRGKKHLVSLLNTLIDHQTVSIKTDLAAAARFLGTVIRRRSSMIILSDFVTPDVNRALNVISRRHEVIAIRVTDAREQELPDVGMVSLEDPETGDQVIVDTSDTEFRSQYAALVAGSDRALAATFSRAGIGQISIRTSDPYDTPLNQFFRGLKRRRRNNARIL